MSRGSTTGEMPAGVRARRGFVSARRMASISMATHRTPRLAEVLAHRGQRRPEVRGFGDVVEPDDADVARHVEACRAEGVNEPERHLVVRGEHRGERQLRPGTARRRGVSARPISKPESAVQSPNSGGDEGSSASLSCAWYARSRNCASFQSGGPATCRIRWCPRLMRCSSTIRAPASWLTEATGMPLALRGSPWAATIGTFIGSLGQQRQDGGARRDDDDSLDVLAQQVLDRRRDRVRARRTRCGRCSRSSLARARRPRPRSRTSPGRSAARPRRRVSRSSATAASTVSGPPGLAGTEARPWPRAPGTS